MEWFGRSGWGLAMPSRSNEGKRRLWAFFTTGGVDSETAVEGRTSAAKLRLRSGRRSCSGLGRSSGEGRGSGKGCGGSVGSTSEVS